jgi:hypothetical protein
MVRKAVGQVSLVEILLTTAYGSNQHPARIRAQVDRQPIEAVLQPMRRAQRLGPCVPAAGTG